MRVRKLRIAWSVAWGVVAVLLIVLWVRSYWRGDYFEHFDSGGDGTSLGSIRGVVYLTQTVDIAHGATPRWGWGNYEVDYNIPSPWSFEVDLSKPAFAAPHWLIAVLCTLFAGATWIRRFTLRTLLIATTLLAVVLGLAVWAAN